MPLALQHSRTNVTKTIAIYFAGSIAPCREGDRVALHISTPEGEVLVQISERAFHEGCRGPADSNLVPWRDLDQRRREYESTPALVAVAPRRTGGRKLAPERLKAYQEIRAIAEAPHDHGAISAACAARGVTHANYASWRRTQAMRTAP